MIGWRKARTMFSLRLTQTESLITYEINPYTYLLDVSTASLYPLWFVPHATFDVQFSVVQRHDFLYN